jgi:lipoyl-dependent peroxiredoxin
MSILYTAHATATGGRNGQAQTSDGVVSVSLSVPKEMGGAGAAGASNPEQLFAMGYAACFGGATEFVARQHKVFVKDVRVAAAVGIGPREAGGFGVTVALEVHIPDVPLEQAQAFVAEAHEKVCPYSHATRGNVPVTITVV